MASDSQRFWRKLLPRKQQKSGAQVEEPAHDRTEPTVQAEPDNKSLRFWDRAYDDLKIGDSKLVEEYENLLTKELSSVDTGPSPSTPNPHISADSKERQLQLNGIITKALDRAKDQGTYHIAGHKINIPEQIAQGASFVQWAKEWIDQAVQASPEASIAWAAISMILPILTKPAAAEQAFSEGFTYVTTRMRYYIALESLMLPQDQGSEAISDDLRKEIEACIVALYQNILIFQIKGILRLYQRALVNFARDMMPGEDWKTMLNQVKKLERTATGDLQQITILKMSERLKVLVRDADKAFEIGQRLLTVAEGQLQVGKEHSGILAEHLSTSKEMLRTLEARNKRALSQQEEKCLQSFRLQTTGKDESYEWYKSRVENRVKGTCQWLLDHSNFKAWLAQESGPLLVSADPGCGKSVLAKYLIDHELPSTTTTICYFFFKDKVQNTLKQALCALIHQLLSTKPSLIRHAMPGYTKNGSNLVDVTDELCDVLYKAGHAPETGQVVFVLDALDECKASDFGDLARTLKRQLKTEEGSSSKVKFLLTCRPYEQIKYEFHDLIEGFPYIRIPGEEESERISHEVNCVIEYRVDQLVINEKIKTHLRQRLLAMSHRTYLWVYLVFDELEQGLRTGAFKKTINGVEGPFNRLPQDVNQAYEKILNRSTNPLKARKTLSIILAATRPLTLKEMNIAVNIETSPRSKSIDELDLEDEEDFNNTLRNWCGLFISIYGGSVYFLHQTAREFLISESSPQAFDSMQALSWHNSISLQRAELVLAEICVTYLDFLDFEEDTLLNSFPQLASMDHSSSRNEGQDLAKSVNLCIPFYEYTAIHWPSHFRRARIEDDTELLSTVLRICGADTKSYLLWAKVHAHPSSYYMPTENSLVLLSFLGLDKAVRLLLQRKVELNDQYSSWRWTALHWTAREGHAAVARVLLEKGAEVDLQDSKGRPALHLAAAWDHEAVARLLLGKGAKVDLQDTKGRTALHWAAAKGHEAVTRMLLEKGAEIDLQDSKGRTALYWTALYWTALSWAAPGDQEAVARLLLEKGAKVDLQDSNGGTALHWAAEFGEKMMIRLLLEKGAKADIENKDGTTPMDWARRRGDHAISELMLRKGGRHDNGGQTVA
ncbi:MAG: hypothetical protein Q9165_008380 [Trypethelium subeluteriae]